MKVRSGFVSNSSTSSFICETSLPIDKVVGILRKIFVLHMDVMKTRDNRDPYIKSFEDMFSIHIADEEDAEDLINYLDKWHTDKYGKKGEGLVGKLLIESSSDNSIPYPLFEYLEYLFNANRVHCG